jgi:hypothetical protein
MLIQMLDLLDRDSERTFEQTPSLVICDFLVSKPELGYDGTNLAYYERNTQ